MATIGEKEIKKKWPVESGLTAGTTKQAGRKPSLTYEKTFVSKREKIGL